MRTFFGLLILVGVALLLRSTALSVLAARGLVLDVLAFATVVWALRHGESWGAAFGFALGLTADLDAAHWLGRHALILSLLGYAVGRLGRALVRDSALTHFVLLFFATLAHEAWVLAFELGGVVGWLYLLQRVASAAIATAPFGTILLFLLRHGSGQPLFGHVAVEPGPSR